MKNKTFIFLICLGFFIRLKLAQIAGFKIDMDAWLTWAIRLSQTGFAHFYSDKVWTNYTPGFLYILYLLGRLKSLFHLSDPLLYIFIKIPSIVAEISIAIFIYKDLSKKSVNWAIASILLILLNPVFIFNSSIWGQIDGLLSLLMILSIYLLSKRKLILSSLLLGLSFLVKPQAIAILPVFGLYLIGNLSFKNFFKILLPTSFILILLSLPFFANQPFSGIIQLFLKMTSDYPYTSLFAYNFWGLVGFWILDNKLFYNLSYQNLGYVIFFGYLILIAYLFFKEKISLYAISALMLLGFYFLPTRVHERYLYPGLVFMIYLACKYKSFALTILTILLSIVHLFNLYYVYVYYNEVYLKLPKLLYYAPVYNFLDVNGKLLSIISVIIFILINIKIISRDIIQSHEIS